MFKNNSSNKLFVSSYQLKNAFDKLFDDLREDKTKEMEPAEVSTD